MKADAIVRVRRGAWELARELSQRTGRDVREITSTAIEDYTRKEAEKVKK